MKKTSFGCTKDGRESSLFTLSNINGMEISVLDFGAQLVSVLVPDKDGNKVDVVLGYDDAAGYENGGFYFGATIGRNGNRIAGGCFEINGKTYQMPINENTNNLHSGPDGYSFRYWDVAEADDDHVTFALFSPDGDQGMPGNFKVTVTYALTDENEVVIRYQGTSDQDTIANMTNHSYFNLNGHASGNVYDQKLQLNASCFSAIADSASIPTGEHAPVAGTPMDFTAPKAIGQDIEADYDYLKMTGGYDHNYILDVQMPGCIEQLGCVVSDQIGITMEVFTDLPAVQFYAGNFITPTTGKGGAKYDKRSGFCLESQYVPDAIHQSHEVQPILKAGEYLDSTTIYKFSASK